MPFWHSACLVRVHYATMQYSDQITAFHWCDCLCCTAFHQRHDAIAYHLSCNNAAARTICWALKSFGFRRVFGGSHGRCYKQLLIINGSASLINVGTVQRRVSCTESSGRTLLSYAMSKWRISQYRHWSSDLRDEFYFAICHTFQSHLHLRLEWERLWHKRQHQHCLNCSQ